MSVPALRHPAGPPTGTTGSQALFFSPDTIWLCPNDLVRFQVRERMWSDAAAPGPGESGFPARPRPRLETFGSLEGALTSELAPPEIDGLERRFILYELAEPLARHLWPEAAAEGAPVGRETRRLLADDLGDGFDRLKLSGLTWDQVARLKPGPLARLLADLGRGHDRLLAARGRQDRFGRRRLLLDRLRAGQEFQALTGVKTIVSRWSQRLSPFETEFLLALARGRQVELTLNVPAWVLEEKLGHGSGFDLLRTIRRIEGSAEPTLWLEFADPALSPAPPALTYAAEALLAPPAARRAGPPPAPADCLTIVQAGTAYHEVEEASRRIKALLLQGDRPHDLAVVVPDLARYGPLLDDVSRRFGLPFHFRRGETLADRGPARAVLSLLDLWSSHWERPRLLELLRGPYFNFPDLPRAELDPGALHRLALAAGVTDRRAGGGFEDNLSRAAAGGGPSARLARKLNSLVRALKKAGADLNAAAVWPDFLARFKKLLNTLGWPGDLASAPTGPENNLQGADLAAAFAFKEELERLEQALAGRPAPEVGLAEFRLWLKAVLSERHLGYDPNPEGRVRVLNYYDLHGGEFTEIFFLGLGERLFPQTGPETRWWPEGFTRAAAQADILGRPLWNEAADRYRQEELMLAAGLSQARRRVTLMYHAGDESGRTALPSPLLTALAELWPDGDGGSLVPSERPVWSPAAPPLARAAGPDELWAGLARLDPADWPAEIPRTPANLAAWRELRRRRERWRAQRAQARLAPAALDRWLDGLEKHQGRPLVRPDFLAAYGDCPFLFWGREVLRLPADGDPVEEWPTTSEGTLLHRVLEKFFRARLGPDGQPGPPWPGQADPEAVRAELLSLLDEELRTFTRENPVGRQPLWRIRRDRLPALLEGWLRRELESGENTRPWRVEWSFGARPESLFEDQAGPWELPLDPTESIFLKGRVDRLDQTGRGLAVRDYKRSHSPGLQVQSDAVPARAWAIHIYALAASAAFGRPAEGFFEILDPSTPTARLSGRPTDTPEMLADPAARLALADEGKFNFPELLAETWRGIAAGRFPPTGDGDGPCRYCSFTLLCPRGQDREEEN